MSGPLFEFSSDKVAGTPAEKAANFLARWTPGKTMTYDTDRDGFGYFQVFLEGDGKRYVSDRMWMDGPDEHEVFLAITNEVEAMLARGEISQPFCSVWVKPDDGIPF
jgi:hypothetical protein